MTATDDALDGAKEKLQAARPKNPSYHVFKMGGEDGKSFTHLTSTGPVKASSRKEAIKAAGVDGKQIEPESFLVIADKEFKVLTRKVRTLVEEVFD